MKTTTKLIGTILTAAALVGFSGAGTAKTASSTERPATDAAVVTTTSSTFEFKVTNFGDRDLVEHVAHHQVTVAEVRDLELEGARGRRDDGGSVVGRSVEEAAFAVPAPENPTRAAAVRIVPMSFVVAFMGIELPEPLAGVRHHRFVLLHGAADPSGADSTRRPTTGGITASPDRALIEPVHPSRTGDLEWPGAPARRRDAVRARGREQPGPCLRLARPPGSGRRCPRLPRRPLEPTENPGTSTVLDATSRVRDPFGGRHRSPPGALPGGVPDEWREARGAAAQGGEPWRVRRRRRAVPRHRHGGPTRPRQGRDVDPCCGGGRCRHRRQRVPRRAGIAHRPDRLCDPLVHRTPRVRPEALLRP